jgi:hypothetical protein
MSTTFSGSNSKPSKKPKICFYGLVSCLAYSFHLKMDAIYSSKTSADFQRTIQRHTSEDRILQNCFCENLRTEPSLGQMQIPSPKSLASEALLLHTSVRVSSLLPSYIWVNSPLPAKPLQLPNCCAPHCSPSGFPCRS